MWPYADHGAVGQRSRQRHALKTHALSVVSVTEEPTDPETELAIEEIWRAVRNLPTKQCDAMLLVYGEDMSHADAATIMGCAESTVSWHIHEAKKTLKELL